MRLTGTLSGSSTSWRLLPVASQIWTVIMLIALLLLTDGLLVSLSLRLSIDCSKKSCHDRRSFSAGFVIDDSELVPPLEPRAETDRWELIVFVVFGDQRVGAIIEVQIDVIHQGVAG